MSECGSAQCIEIGHSSVMYEARLEIGNLLRLGIVR